MRVAETIEEILGIGSRGCLLWKQEVGFPGGTKEEEDCRKGRDKRLSEA